MPNKNRLALLVVALARTKLVKENEPVGKSVEFAEQVRYTRVRVDSKQAISDTRCCVSFLLFNFSIVI